ncbi:MAG: NAD-dependent epimerase/dehydratase family protein, partial [Candidatus Paceibacterota bacterium]
MKTILITGGAGFIGSNVVEDLLNQKESYKLIVIDNLNDYYSPEHKKENIKPFLNKITFYEGDITDKDFLIEIFNKENIDKVIHLAARAGVRPSIENPDLYVKTNILGTINLLELSKENNIENFIFASSSSVYGERKEVPFKESDNIGKVESPYAQTKKSAEELIYLYNKLYSLNSVCLRFFTVYGERGRPDMAPYLFTKAIINGETINKFGDGSSKRDYTYIKDITKGIIKCLDKNFGYEIINLGYGSPITLNDFIETLEKTIDKKANINQIKNQPGDVST